jgi:hypothetical protein
VVILLVGLKLEVVILLVGLRLEVVILLVGLRLEVVILLVGLIDNIFGFIDNICVSFGETLFQQVVGILI